MQTRGIGLHVLPQSREIYGPFKNNKIYKFKLKKLSSIEDPRQTDCITSFITSTRDGLHRRSNFAQIFGVGKVEFWAIVWRCLRDLYI